MSSVLYMIRHGESIANAGLPSSDFSTIPLTPLGHEQSARLANGWSDAPSLIAASPYLRAQQTAVPLREKFKSVPFVTWGVEEFSFLNLCMFPPMTRDERKSLVDDYWQRCDPSEKHAGAESFEEFWGRVLAFQRQVEQFDGERLVVVTHGFFMRGFEFGRTYGFGKCSRVLMNDLYSWLPPSPHTNACVIEYAK